MSYLRSTLAHLYADDRLFVLSGLYENATGWRWNGQSAVPIANTTGSLYWGPGEPNLKSGKCVGVMSLGGYLKAFDCMQTAPFICEMDEK
ncbi:hypothetical protein DPMN_095036 [Dreissena polymorpha]|uniref:C-type lectin domain-containing protein n=1 Tax=Dreissena polymorpha TaxID=45954 RepID=A0A9D4R3E7_DREPO|nr:hypothetical protein DPMN_095036 [Dreissena polymorpha]